MPLKRGKGKAIVSKNVEELRKAGYPQRQTVAIAPDKAREGKKK